MDLQNIFLTLLTVAEKPLLKGLFNNIYEQHPTDAKLAVAMLYPVIDTKLEDWAIANGKNLPKSVITKAKEVCEELATEWGMALSNVDAGTPND